MDKKWTCGVRNCKQSAPYIFTHAVKKKGTVSFDLQGRCEKHKTENCLTIEEMKKICES